MEEEISEKMKKIGRTIFRGEVSDDHIVPRIVEGAFDVQKKTGSIGLAVETVFNIFYKRVDGSDRRKTTPKTMLVIA